MSYEVIHGDCLDALRALPDNSVDAVVTDPPYGLSFMGKKWDYDVPATDVWAECLRVLKPGGHLLAFAGTRTQHRMCVRIEDAGFEIRDMIAWLYGQGFPKSLDVSKAIDKGEGHWRGRAGSVVSTNGSMSAPNYKRSPKGDPVTAAAAAWSGWGTALKPSWESVTWATKPTPEQSERAIIVSNLSRLEARLWLLSSASAAAKSSKSSPSEYDAACGTAQWDADAITNTRAALCDQMGTSQFELATTTSLNIASLWKRILAESWDRASTSTTETESSTTTDLQTLRFSLSQITPESIVAACSRPGGFDANASTAERHFNASVALLQSIHTLSATGRAMSRAAENSLDAGVRPSLDPCIMARKPLDGTVAKNVQEWGTGAINVDGCRVPHDDDVDMTAIQRQQAEGTGIAVGKGFVGSILGKEVPTYKPGGRWPANLIHDGSEEVEALTGSAARFFYCAKASKADRDDGLQRFEVRRTGGMQATADGSMLTGSGNERTTARANHHPTVKPTALMQYLCRLVTPSGGTVLDPFTGSGSTGRGAILEGFNFIGIEREAGYVEIARARIAEAERRHSESFVSA